MRDLFRNNHHSAFYAGWLSQIPPEFLNSTSIAGSHPGFRPWTRPGALYFIGNFLVSAAWACPTCFLSSFVLLLCLMNVENGRNLAAVRRRRALKPALLQY